MDIITKNKIISMNKISIYSTLYAAGLNNVQCDIFIIFVLSKYLIAIACMLNTRIQHAQFLKPAFANYISHIKNMATFNILSQPTTYTIAYVHIINKMIVTKTRGSCFVIFIYIHRVNQ